jgi:hypothetical protein
VLRIGHFNKAVGSKVFTFGKELIMQRVSVSERRSLVVLAITLIATLVVLSLGIVNNSYAYDPTPALRNLYGAPYALISVYEVKPGMEPQFLDVMVKAGPFNKQLSGFANERIVQPLPTAEGGNTPYSCISRYYDLGTATFVEKERDAAVRSFVTRAPVRYSVKLVEHWLGDWSWEKRSDRTLAAHSNDIHSSFLRVEAFKNDEIFQKNISSLSFFKAGYVGQVGMLEIYPKGTSLEQIRAQIQTNPGLSGASIFAIGDEGQYACYSEFFKSPTDINKHAFTATGNALTGSQAGTVVQNYVPR